MAAFAARTKTIATAGGGAAAGVGDSGGGRGDHQSGGEKGGGEEDSRFECSPELIGSPFDKNSYF